MELAVVKIDVEIDDDQDGVGAVVAVLDVLSLLDSLAHRGVRMAAVDCGLMWV